MPADVSDDDNVSANSDERGFTDDAFDARYDGKRSPDLNRRSTVQAGDSRSSPHATPAAPRSRNSYMRTRARRLSASRPSDRYLGSTASQAKNR
jgi:hypothetical protein